MKLSDRLETVISLVTKGSRVADIGTDHGYIPIFLVSEGICPSALAMDINEKPLNRARCHIKEAGLDDQIACIQSDGLEGLQEGMADAIIIAGMGGDLMINILSERQGRLIKIKELILSPQSHWERVRHFLHQSKYRIIQERFLSEDGKYYLFLKCIPGIENFEKEIYYDYGKLLLERKDQVLKEYLEKEMEQYQNILKKLFDSNNELVKKRRDEVIFELLKIEEALNCYEM